MIQSSTTESETLSTNEGFDKVDWNIVALLVCLTLLAVVVLYIIWKTKGNQSSS